MRFNSKKTILGRVQKIKGIAMLWLAISIVVLILFMGIAIDGSRVYLTANQLQNAADAAALAGARTVRTDQEYAREQARYIAGLNFALKDSVAVSKSRTSCETSRLGP